MQKSWLLAGPPGPPAHKHSGVSSETTGAKGWSQIKHSGDKPPIPFPACEHSGEDQYHNIP